MATSSRIFSFGLGQSSSRSLIKGLARATNGRFVFIPPGSNVDLYVGEQLQKALQVSLTNLQIKWNLGTTVTSVPEKIPPIYGNDRLIIYALANDSTALGNPDATVELYTDKYRFGRVNINRVPHVTENGVIARLAAKALILRLQHSKLPPTNNLGSLQTRFQTETQTSSTISEEKEKTKQRIIQLSLKHNILSPHTAFVGVERRDNGNNTAMILREVPIQISADDQHLRAPQFMRHHASALKQRTPNAPPVWCNFSAPPRLRVHKQSYDIKSVVYDAPMCCYEINRPVAEDISSFNSMRSLDDSAQMRAIQQMLEIERIRVIHGPILVTERVNDDPWHTGDENIVRYLIRKQQLDGRWDLDASDIQQLTGKPLASFSSFTDPQLIVSAIVIFTLETRFASLSTLWFGVVQKARKRLLDLLGNDRKKLAALLDYIRQQL
jgi:hypothetical protein